MNTEEKKLRERRALDMLLALGQLKTSSVEHRDEPDFLVTIGNHRVGIEVTGYFQYPKAGNKVPQCRLEDAWRKLNDEIRTALPQSTFWGTLQHLCVRVFLRDRTLPESRHLKELAKTLVALVETTLRNTGPVGCVDIADFGGSKLASDYVANIRVLNGRSATFRDWECDDVLMGWVGLCSEFIESSMKDKSRKVPKYRANTDPDKLWLLFYAEGWQPSSFTLPAQHLCAELRNLCASSHSLFASSGFDSIFFVVDSDKCGCQLFPEFRQLRGVVQ